MIEARSPALPVYSRLWYALCVKCRFEAYVLRRLEEAGHEAFFPTYVVSGRHSGDEHIVLPLFPRRVFCRFDVRDGMPVLMTPGVESVAGAMCPQVIDDGEVSAIRRAHEAAVPMHPSPYVTEGENVCLRSGPLHGLKGILVREKKTEHLILSISPLKRSVAIEIDHRWTEPVPRIFLIPHGCSTARYRGFA